jgi:hypothetical protein
MNRAAHWNLELREKAVSNRKQTAVGLKIRMRAPDRFFKRLRGLADGSSSSRAWPAEAAPDLTSGLDHSRRQIFLRGDRYKAGCACALSSPPRRRAMG